MAQKKGGRSAASDEPEDLARTPLQAVLLADSFAQNFRPITLERPKVLLPLVNVPMIEYSLAWLESVGVEEVFVFCCAHSGQVKEFLEKSQWTKQPSTFKVTTIESHDAISAGDALRVIYSHGTIRGDFILISGDTVSNMSLKEALHVHKERRKKDPLAVMTMVIKHSKPSSVTHQTRLGNDEIVMAIDPETKELLYYEDKIDHSQRFISLDNMLADNPSLCLHNDKQDCYIDICSPDVLTLFTDNFDYQHLRRHFVKGLLVDDLPSQDELDSLPEKAFALVGNIYEGCIDRTMNNTCRSGRSMSSIMGYKIFTHEIHSSYAARVDNFRSYDTISKDIILRWTYPFVPDVQYFGNCSQMKFDRQGLYKTPGVIQSRSAQICSFSLIGDKTTLGDNSCISNSVIGQGCTIGRNVSIEGSYIWDNVTIEDNCRISYTLVCDGVNLREGVLLEPGTILSYKVEVGQQLVIPAYSKVSLLPQPSKQDSDDELEYADTNSGVVESPSIMTMGSGKLDLMPSSSDAQDWDTSVVTISGAGYIWSACEAGYDEEWRHSIAPIPAEKLNDLFLNAHAELDEPNQDISCIPTSGELPQDSESTGFDDGDGEDSRDSADFEKEVEATFRRAFTGVEQENVIIEINSLRLSYNMSHADCAGALFYSILRCALQTPHSSQRELLANAAKEIDKWKNLLKNYLKSIDEEIEVILKFEEVCLESAKDFSPLFTTILNHLYDKEIVSEDAVLSWAKEKEDADEDDKTFVRQSEQFITWLREASEEEEDDGDDDDVGE